MPSPTSTSPTWAGTPHRTPPSCRPPPRGASQARRGADDGGGVGVHRGDGDEIRRHPGRPSRIARSRRGAPGPWSGGEEIGRAGAVADKERAPSAGSTRRRDHRLGSGRESRSPPDGQPGDLNRPAIVTIDGDQVTARGQGEANQAPPYQPL